MSTSRTVTSTSSTPSWMARLPSWVPSAILTVALAFAVSYVGVQRGQSVTDTRLTTAERDIREGKEAREKDREQMIGRREFEQFEKNIDAIKKSVDKIEDGVRDLRNRSFQK